MPNLTYEERLSSDTAFAVRESGSHFEEGGAVPRTLRRITAKLDELGIAYALVGGMAMFRHGYRRFTEDVDLLVTEASLAEVHDRLDGLGWVPPFPGSKQLRDAETGVRIEFLVSGRFPGDGKPKPVAFPDPEGVTVEIDGVHVLTLHKLIELKLASGMSNAGRLRDLADVQDLIRHLGLEASFADDLDASVAPTFRDLHIGVASDG